MATPVVYDFKHAARVISRLRSRSVNYHERSPERPRRLLDAVHREPAVQGKAAPACRAPRACTTGRPTAARCSTARPACGASTPATAARRSPRRSSKQIAVMDYAPPFQMGHPIAFELANALVQIAPKGLDHVFFTNSGSESVDTALKIALAYHRVRGEGARTRLIGRERGYHGVGFGGISVGGMVNNRKYFGAMLPGVDHLRAHARPRAQRLLERPAGARRRIRRRPRAAGRAARCLDDRRGHRRADRRLDRRAAAAEGLPQAPARDLRQARHPADLRRGHHRLRAHGLGLRGAGIRRHARHDHLRQGAHQRRRADGRGVREARDPRRVHAGPGRRDRAVPRLHLLGAPDRLRGRARDAGHLSQRRPVRARARDGAVLVAMPCTP